MRNIIIAGVVSLAAGFGLGHATSGGASEPTPHHEGHWVVEGPECPTEDSCTADYNNGMWSITEVTP